MTISKCFVTAANHAGAIRKKKLSQSTLLKAEPSVDGRKGVCGALSLLYLGYYAREGLEGMTQTLQHSWSGLLEYALLLQHQIMQAHNGVQDEAQTLTINLCNAAPHAGLRGSGIVMGLDWPCAGDLARLVTERSGHWVIALPNHYVAAAYDGRLGMFYDPNAGAALFEGVHGFTAMLTYFFSNHEVTHAYQCSGRRIYALPFERS